MPIQLNITREEKYALFSVGNSNLDNAAIQQLKEAIIVANAEGCINIILDLPELETIDASGMGALLIGSNLCRDAGGIFLIARPEEHVNNIIAESELKDILVTLPTLDECIEAVFFHELERELGLENFNE